MSKQVKNEEDVDSVIDSEAKAVKPTTRPLADRMWSSIKEKKIDIFSLPNQKVKDHCQQVQVVPTELWLKPKSPAVLPALEQSFSEYLFELTSDCKFIVVRKKDAVL